MKRLAFIYNPGAKGGRSESAAQKLKHRVRGMHGAELFRSKSKGDIAGLVNELKSNFDFFIACGGDGTVREVASQLVSTDKTMGIIPLGSGNDLCKSLNIPNNFSSAFGIIQQGSITKIDVGRCNDFIFLNSLGFGFDGLTNRYADKLQRFPGFFRYMVAAMKANLKHAPFDVHISNGKRSTEETLIMLTFANGRVEGGSFWIAPNASITDGKLELVKITPVNRLKVLFLLPLFMIRKSHLFSDVNHSEIRSAELIFDRSISIHADGEIIETTENEFLIKLQPSALRVIHGF